MRLPDKPLAGLGSRISAGMRARPLALSVLVGVAGACGAIGLFLGLDCVSAFCQGHLIGVVHPKPTGEIVPRLKHGSAASHPLLALCVPALGGLFSGLLADRQAPAKALWRAAIL